MEDCGSFGRFYEENVFLVFFSGIRLDASTETATCSQRITSRYSAHSGVSPGVVSALSRRGMRDVGQYGAGVTLRLEPVFRVVSNSGANLVESGRCAAVVAL